MSIVIGGRTPLPAFGDFFRTSRLSVSSFGFTLSSVEDETPTLISRGLIRAASRSGYYGTGLFARLISIFSSGFESSIFRLTQLARETGST